MGEENIGGLDKSGVDSLVLLAIEGWRFANLFQRLLERLEPSAAKRYVNQLEWFRNQISQALAPLEARVIDLTGQLYDPGIAASPINLDDFEEEETLVVVQMIEPIIMGRDGILKPGTVLLGRKV